MADFRRVVTALAVLALLTGFAVTANAQNTGAFACTASAAVPPLLRAEGLTELTGDIVLNCTGGTAGTSGAAIPTANVSVFLGNTNVTSRLQDSSGTTEALLLVDEPSGTAVNVAASATTGCGATGGAPGCTVGGTNPNAFRGLLTTPNSVTFIGVPVNPPGTSGTRIFRITNIRANAAAIGAGTTGNLASSQLQAFVSISGSTSIPLTSPLQVVGFVQPGLSFSARNAAATSSLATAGFSFLQCVSQTAPVTIATLRYTEGFATAFKLRGTTSQNTAGFIYNTESGFTPATIGGSSSNLGLADFATRLRATFANIPTGVNVYVSVANTNTTISSVANTASAVLTSSETGSLSTVSAGSSTAGFAAVTISSGSGVAVWEVTNSSPLAVDTLEFQVAIGTTANPAGNSPAVGTTGTVSGSFAPVSVPPAGTTAAEAGSSARIPRFIGGGTPVNLVFATICRTNILFPFVTNANGFDTGLAIANTSKDPFTTPLQAGTCTLNFYGDNAPSALPPGDPVQAGTVRPYLISAIAPAFQGYVIAQCNFQFAHGFAFISDVGARNLAMGYLGLIIPEPARRIDEAGGSEVLGL